MTINRQKEVVHLFRQLIERYGNDIVIKGAFSLILNTIEKYPDISNRFTMDIDFYLKCEFANFMESLVTSKISTVGGEIYKFTKLRTPKKNSGGRIEAVAGEINAFIDVQIDEYLYPDAKTFDDIIVAITTPVSIAMDKMDAISKPKVIDRPKDLYDLFVISLLYDIEFQEIISHRDFKITGDFETFVEEWEMIKESYNREEILIGLEQPDFDTLYIRVKEFVSPFIVSKELTTKDLIWSTTKGVWCGKEPTLQLSGSSIFADRRKNKQQ